MRRQFVPALVMTVCLTVLTGIVYPLAVSGASSLLLSRRANGSIVKVGGTAVGSSLLGQNFSDSRYFWSRPSAAGPDGYDGLASGGSNLGPSNETLIKAVRERAEAYRRANHVAAGEPVPVDAVTASASGLDPDISVANAHLQARRVAEARGLPVEKVKRLVAAHTRRRPWGILGEEAVNVLDLNVALDRQGTS